jgi:GTP-binding protein YchF
MGLAAGIVGLPNVGKSTIFSAVSSARAEAANYPFCTIDPNHGVVAIPDENLRRITALIPTKKVIPTFLELVDIAGLVKGASQGEGLGNQFLGHIKDVNALAHVVRCFDNSDIVHVEGSVDPVRDVEIINTELILKDLDTVERGITRVGKAAKSGDKEAKAKLVVFERLHAALASGTSARKVISPEEQPLVRELNLLTAKPVIYVANVDENSLNEDNEYVKILREFATAEGAECMVVCGKIECELAELALEERAEFLESMGLSEPGLNVLVRSLYQLLGLQTFFTAGPTENRAWTIRANSTAPQAAGAIHSDFERGFIRAEVYSLADLEQYKTEAAIKAAGKMRSEGRDYVVQDGDIMFFKFNV